MNDFCGVPTCRGSGVHEIDGETRLCRKHALAWDKSEDARGDRLIELNVNDPGAAEEDLWAAHKSEWLGAQK